MLRIFKERLEAKRQKAKAIGDSQHWKTDPRLRACLQTLRGSCTVAPMELHEAAIAVVNIALREDTWSRAEEFPADFLAQTVYVVWNNPFFPVLKAERDVLIQQLSVVTAVAAETYLVGETMDRVIRIMQDGSILLYSVAS